MPAPNQFWPNTEWPEGALFIPSTSIRAGGSTEMETEASAVEPFVVLVSLSTQPQIGQTGTEIVSIASASNVEVLGPSPAPSPGVTGTEKEIQAGGEVTLHG
jgi:hypothetical protein